MCHHMTAIGAVRKVITSISITASGIVAIVDGVGTVITIAVILTISAWRAKTVKST